MGFIMDGLDTEEYDRTYSDWVLLKRIVGYFVPHARLMALIGLTLAASSAAGIVAPLVISQALNVVVNNASLSVFGWAAFAIAGVGALSWLLNFVLQRALAHVTGNVVLQLREDVFSATMGHDMSFFDDYPSGKIVSRVTSDTQDFGTMISLVTDFLGLVLVVAVLTGVLFSISVTMTLIVIAFAPIAAAIALSFRKIARKVTQRARRIVAVINAQIQESISGIVVAKSYRQERSIYRTFLENNRRAYRVGLDRGLVLNTIFPVMSLTSGAGIAVVVFAGGWNVATQVLDPGQFYLFMQAVGFFWWPLMNISSFWSQFQDGLSAAERVFALIDAEPRVVQTAHEPVPALQGHIVFDAVDFSYNTTEQVLNRFSLDIPAGTTVAIVGHTGAGKSSLARLITRFYDFQAGEIRIDGRNLRHLDLSQYRRHVGLVPQDPFLFSGTVRENIRYGRPDADDAAVEAAAMHIAAGEWVHDLPDGLDTSTGNRGSTLSMGQRQLVALARVLLKNPAVFILDEATASVDPFTETQIQQGLNVVLRDRTAIIIAHRLWTVRHADTIIVLDHGKIVEQGNHHDLMARGGAYATLFNTYFRHQSLEYIDEIGRR